MSDDQTAPAHSGLTRRELLHRLGFVGAAALAGPVVLAACGSSKSFDLQNALKDKPTLASVYGGDDSAVGTFSMDPVTHSVSRRQMGVFEYKSGKVKPLALFNIKGADYKKM